MKIYEIGTGYTPIPAKIGAATEVVVEELTKAFLKKRVPVEIVDIAADDRPDHQLPIREVKVPRQFSGTDVQLGIMHKLKRVVYSVSLAFVLRKILKKSREKVLLHFHNQYNLFFFYKLVPAALRQKAHVSYTNHSYIWHGVWDEIKDTVQKKYFQEVYCIKHADSVFVLNEQTKQNLITHLQVEPERVRLIHNGVNVDIYAVLAAEEKLRLQQEYGLSGKKIFIQVGSVCDRKNQLTAVKLLLPLMQQDRDVVFCYVGGVIDQEYQASIEQFASDHHVGEQVRYLGELQPGKQLNCFYNLAEAMVFPSKAEGFSLVIVEAMAAGVPVLVKDDLKFKLAKNCLQYQDEEDFVQTVRTHILNPVSRDQIAGDVRETVLAEYSWDKVAQTYMDVWNEKFEQTAKGLM